MLSPMKCCADPSRCAAGALAPLRKSWLYIIYADIDSNTLEYVDISLQFHMKWTLKCHEMSYRR